MEMEMKKEKKKAKRYVIVGGVAGGATAAARLRRLDKDAQIVLFERGEHISFANCGLPYYVGDEIKESERLLLMTPELFRERFAIDVRTKSEYGMGHIPKAINIANESIGSQPPAELPDKDQLILVYCRSGKRSHDAAQKLAAMGYGNVVDFGGIMDWPGEVVQD